MIYITGDTHGLVQRFNTLKEKYYEDKWTENDYLIICGDFGYIFFNNGPENRFLDELEKSLIPYALLMVTMKIFLQFIAILLPIGMVEKLIRLEIISII